MNVQPPGADVVRTPPPLTEKPAVDRFCDLVLTGGVASGVVYPWAILEIARAFRFRNIGGTSVGAMAAALAAGAEYGRRTGAADSFEALRRVPGSLGEILPDGRTRILSLFQPRPAGQRLFDLFVRAVMTAYQDDEPSGKVYRMRDFLCVVPRAYRCEILRWVGRAVVAWLVVCAVVFIVSVRPAHDGRLDVDLFGWGLLSGAALALACAAAAVFGLARGVISDIGAGMVDNDLGLCRGGGSDDPAADRTFPALVRWLHDGIQAGAGLRDDGRPLTFRDLWNAPLRPGDDAVPCTAASNPCDRSINLEMITTNVTYGRPYRLPLVDEDDRLFYRPEELARFFPEPILSAMRQASSPYAPRSDSDPAAGLATEGFFELPGPDMPIVVAARLSLSYPLLFSAVPLYAIDYEPADPTQRGLRRCWFSDGGLCSNFPIHLFDAALPRWPTFGMWLGTRPKFRPDEAVWLPDCPADGRGDTRQRFAATEKTPTGWARASQLLGFLIAAGSSAKDWSDLTAMRMPQTRNRVARLGLKSGEGSLNIAMRRERILRMAETYGTTTGQLFVRRYAGTDDREPTQSWREQRWVRMRVLVEGLHRLLDGVGRASGSQPGTTPLCQDIVRAVDHDPARQSSTLTRKQEFALADALAGIRALEATLDAGTDQPDISVPMPELRLRPPL